MEREVGGGIGMGNTCKPMAVLFQCMTKFTTNKKKKKSTFLSCIRFQTSGDTQFLIFKGIKIVLHLQWVGGVSLTFIPFT